MSEAETAGVLDGALLVVSPLEVPSLQLIRGLSSLMEQQQKDSKYCFQITDADFPHNPHCFCTQLCRLL